MRTAIVAASAVCLIAGVGDANARHHHRSHVAAAHKAGRAAVENPAESPKAEPAAAAAPTAAAPVPVAAAAPSSPIANLLTSIFQPTPSPVAQLAPVAEPAVAAVEPEAAGGVTSVPRSAPLRALVAKHAAANGVPFPLAHAVIMIESKYTPRVAHAGNYGLMQIRAQTARGMGFTGSASGLLDAETNLRYGMKYLALAYRMAHGDTCGTVMRYQSGTATTRMSAANRAYCAKARAFMAKM